MALYSELPIYKHGCDLLSLALDVQTQMPRMFKRSLGEKIHALCVDMLENMAMANASRGAARAQQIAEPASQWVSVAAQVQAMLAAAPAPPKAETPLTGNEEVDRIIARLDSSDPDFDDCAEAVALFIKMVEESKGPDGFASWKDAAIAARISASPAVVDQPPVAVVDEDEDGLFADFETEIGVVVKRGDMLYAAPPPQQIAEPARTEQLDDIADSFETAAKMAHLDRVRVELCRADWGIAAACIRATTPKEPS